MKILRKRWLSRESAFRALQLLDVERDAGELNGHPGEGRLGRERESEGLVARATVLRFSRGADSVALRAGGGVWRGPWTLRRLLGGAVELGGAGIASEAVGNEGRLVSAIETTLVRAMPRAGTRRRRSGRGS